MERVKRPKLPRTHPLRSWSAFAGATAARGTESPDGGGSEETPATLGSVVARSVDLGYRVVDEYIRQGQKAAERVGTRAFSPNVLAGEMQELGVRMMQYASDAYAFWLEFAQLATTGRVARRGVAPGDGAAGHPAPAAAGGGAVEGAELARVRIEVVSPWPTEVSLDLRPDATGRLLVVHALRAVDPEKRPLDEVSFRSASAGEPTSLRIRVPVEQPAGVYSGLVIDEQTCTSAGWVSVRISRPGATPGP